MKKLLDSFVYLFWASQVWILSSCPPIQSLVLNSGVNADRSAILWLKLFCKVIFRLPFAFFRHIRDKIQRKIVLPRISFPITSRCTLNCDKCMARVPDIKKHEDFPIEELLRSLDILLTYVDEIYVLHISGGEAFMHPDLDQLLRYCIASAKIKKVDIATNGTIIPNENVLKALHDAEAIVRITKYPKKLQPNVEKLKSVLEDNRILFMHEVGDYWYDIPTETILQPGSAKRKFRVCTQRLCLMYFRAVIYPCSLSVALNEGKLIPDCSDDYIDLRSSVVSTENFNVRWKKLRKKRWLLACSYCQGCSYNTPRVPVAVQRTKNKGEEKHEEIT